MNLILTMILLAKAMSGLTSCDTGGPVELTPEVVAAYAQTSACETDTECELAAMALNDVNVCGW